MPDASTARATSYSMPGPMSQFEARVIGAALTNPDALDSVMTSLVPGDLVDQTARAVFEAIVDMAGADRPVQPSTVATHLEATGSLEGALEAVQSLISVAAPVASLPEMLTSVRGCASARISAYVGKMLAAVAEGSGGDQATVAAAVAQAQEDLAALSETDGDEEWQTLGDATWDLLNEGPVSPMCSTGMPDLDDILQGGLRPGQLVIVAARPAMGKSTLAFDFCRHASVHEGVPSVYVSLEMSRRELAMRLVAAEASVDMRTVMSMSMDTLSEGDRRAVMGAQQTAAGAPMVVVDPVDASWPAVAAQIRAAHRRAGGGPMLAVIDYLGLVALDGNAESRQNGLQEVSRRSKQMAKSLGIAVVLVAQLNRGPEMRADHKPMMADLRETGSLEQDADIVLLLFRPDYYDATERVGEADVIVAKQRNGSTGTVPMVFQGHYSRFAPLAKSFNEEPSGGGYGY